jgi:predicted membrane-bound spermidine synthase
VDWDDQLTDLFKDKYSYINEESLNNSLVRIENADIQEAFDMDDRRYYDVILVDLLDPNFDDLHQCSLWESVMRALKFWGDRYGSIVINAGGITPWNVDNLNALIGKTREYFDEAYHSHIHLYKVFVPSFGREWCFILINQREYMEMNIFPSSLKYCSPRTWRQAYSDGWCSEYLRNIDLNLSHQLEPDD